MTKNNKRKNQRCLVLELTVQIEEIISKTLGLILEINWRESESLGYKSSALGFNQKVRIIQDIKGLDKEIVKKFDALMFIRNKFAHVKEVNSFETLDLVSNNATQIKRNLHNWYSKEGDNFENEEEKNLNYFIRLCGDTQDYLTKISKEHAYKKGFALGQKEADQRIVDELLVELREIDGGDVIIDKILAKLKEEFEK